MTLSYHTGRVRLMNETGTGGFLDEHRIQAPLTIAGERLFYACSMAYTDVLYASRVTLALDNPPYIYVVWSKKFAARPVYIGMTNIPNASRLQNTDHPVMRMVQAAMLDPSALQVYWYESRCGGAIWSLERDLQRSLNVLYRDGSEARVRLNHHKSKRDQPTLRDTYLAIYHAFSVDPNMDDPMWQDSDMDRLVPAPELKEIALNIAGALGVPRKTVLDIWKE